ncbi:hypothetical protein PG984_013356 [Apiospora sp. TS-2023a]
MDPTINWSATFGELCSGDSEPWLSTESAATGPCRSTRRKSFPSLPTRDYARTPWKTLRSSIRPGSYTLQALIPCFLEAEGLLDDITSDRWFRDLKLFGHNFLESYNASIAERALEQETWVGRANYAWQLWDRIDACDPLVAYDLREVNEREEPEENGCHPGRECQCDAAYWDGIEAIECYSREVD